MFQRAYLSTNRQYTEDTLFKCSAYRPTNERCHSLTPFNESVVGGAVGRRPILKPEHMFRIGIGET